MILTLFFLTSGLFLGWSLGANDAANIFGTAVGSRMVKFRTAAIVASLFVIIGAVLQGNGTTKTLSDLGTVNAIGGAFTVALSSGIIVFIMTKNKLPVSTGQAIVGAIIGWCYFTSNPVNYSILGKIVGSWIVGPILGAIFSAILYILVRKFIKRTTLHLIKLESIIRISLIVVGAFGAYSLGANNIANVMGIFVNAIDFNISLGGVVIGTTQILFFLGGVAISLGIFTYSKKVMETVGGEIIPISPEGAIVVVLAQAIVLFVFSSTTLSNISQSIGLPAIPLVPVSSTQVVVGSVLGIGLVKGMQEVKFSVVGNIMMGWILTPILSGAFAFLSLFFVKNIFDVRVSSNAQTQSTSQIVQPLNINIPINTNDALLVLLLMLLASVSTYLVLVKLKNYSKPKDFEHHLEEKMQYSEFQKALSEIEINTIQLENTQLVSHIQKQKKEIITYSININEQRQYLDSFSKSLQRAINAEDVNEKNAILNEELINIKQKMSYSGELDNIYKQAEQVHISFMEKLKTLYPDLSSQEKRLMMLLRIGLSSKEIAPLLNISIKSVEITRYRLRKKLNLGKNTNLIKFTKNL